MESIAVIVSFQTSVCFSCLAGALRVVVFAEIMVIRSFAYDIEKNKIGIFGMLMAEEICHEYRNRNGRGGDRRRSR